LGLPVSGLTALMVLGCSSNAGKSLVVTGLCRWFAGQGVDVAPFKAQNMSNNARVVNGGEIGVAQWLQAKAAGIEPTVDMNPVLVKPEADSRSQVVVGGVARSDLTDMPWSSRGPHLWPAMTDAYDRVRAAHELVVLEGAGSPAEINLPDLVNNRMLYHADANALLVADIDRGGAFAHIVGTWALVPAGTRQRLAGFVLNRFRGDAALLEPAPSQVAELTGMRHVGVLPELRHELPDEEGGTIRAVAPLDALSAAIVRYPYASNLDEWHLVGHAAHCVGRSRPQI
jgi:adenosylcobyric acid synthase